MSNADTVLGFASAQVGKPYVWAAAGPNAFDCSGLTRAAYKLIGVELIHQTNSQYAQLEHRPFSQAGPGDLIFYRRGIDIYHVAIYDGSGGMIHAANTDLGVIHSDVWSENRMDTVGVMPGGVGGNTPGAGDTSAGTSGAPFTVEQAGNLTLPLSAGNRAIIMAWFRLQASLGKITGFDPDAMEAASDQELITEYQKYLTVIEPKGQSLNPMNALDGVNNLMHALTQGNTWVRVGMFAAGAILIGVATNSLLKNNGGYQKVKGLAVTAATKGAVK